MNPYKKMLDTCAQNKEGFHTQFTRALKNVLMVIFSSTKYNIHSLHERNLLYFARKPKIR